VGNKNNDPLALLLIGSFLIILAEFIKKIQKQPVQNKKDLTHLSNRKIWA
jgi:hypothetical protein